MNAFCLLFRKSLNSYSTRRVPETGVLQLTAQSLNLRLERGPTLSIWGSDTCMLYSPDTPCGRTCHRCTCHPHEQPWGETQGLKHNRGIELCLSFLNLWVELYARLPCVEGFLRLSVRRALEFPDSHFHAAPMFMQPFLAFSVPQFGERILGRSV